MPIKVVKKLKYKYQIIKDPTRVDKNELFHIRNFVMLCIGKPGSGKSLSIINLLKRGGPYYRRFFKVFFISPSTPDIKIQNVLRIPENQYGDNFDDIGTFLEMADGSRSCFILDDCQPLFKSGNTSDLNKLVVASHHCNSSVMITSHSLSTTPPIIKKSSHIICLARGVSKAELQSLERYLPCHDMEDVIEAYRYATEKSLPLFLINDGRMLVGLSEEVKVTD